MTYEVSADQILGGEVMHGEFAALETVKGWASGPWRAACIFSYTGPVWVFVHTTKGDVVPLSAVVCAYRGEPR